MRLNNETGRYEMKSDINLADLVKILEQLKPAVIADSTDKIVFDFKGVTFYCNRSSGDWYTVEAIGDTSDELNLALTITALVAHDRYDPSRDPYDQCEEAVRELVDVSSF